MKEGADDSARQLERQRCTDAFDMTRENKLALVVGFALILVVGILISDHFSPARNHEAAELATVEDPIGGPRMTDEGLVAVRPPRRDQPPIIDEPIDPRPRRDTTPRDDRPRDDRQADDSPGRATIPASRSERGADEPVRPRERFHDVRKGETLTAICRQYYGDATMLAAFIKFNEIDQPDRVNVGRRLRVPPIEALGGSGANESARAQANPALSRTQPPAAPRTYTVRSGDSLTEIATELLGTSKAYVRIFELNRDKLDSPDDIREGMVLRIPSS